MTCEMIKKDAARQVHQWISEYPERFIDKVEELLQLHVDYEADSKRLNPPTGEWPPKQIGWEPIESELFDPFLCLVGSDMANPNPIEGRTLATMPTDSTQVLLVFYAVLLCLHESTSGYKHITADIWPKDNPLSLFHDPGGLFDEKWGDKSALIEAAMIGVKDDLKKHKNTHSDDFRSIVWDGVLYSLTFTQAQCVKVLWENSENGCPEVSGLTIAEKIGSRNEGKNNYRLRDLFKNDKINDPPTWNNLIVEGKTNGTYRLSDKKIK